MTSTTLPMAPSRSGAASRRTASGTSARRLLRRLVPGPLRRRARAVARELPVRLADLLPDLGQGPGLGPGLPLPPARLRRRVGLTSSRDEFERVGRESAETLLAAVGDAGVGGRDPAALAWLDFGCGSGRVARALHRRGVERLVGVDVDAPAVAWADRHLPGTFRVGTAAPPLTAIDAGLFADGRFDVAYAVSVFSHMDREAEALWLAELVRLLAPGGLLLATTHGPQLCWARPDLTEEHHRRLAEEGFLFVPGPDAATSGGAPVAPSERGGFNHDSAFHHRSTLERRWGRLLEPVGFVAGGLGGYQDLSIWRRRAEAVGAALSDSPGTDSPIRSDRSDRSGDAPAGLAAHDPQSWDT